MKLYKLTKQDDTTQDNTQWGENITHMIPPEAQSKRLCVSGILHAYKDINLALLLNPLHARFFPVKLWEAEGEIVVEDWGKVGCHKLTTIKVIDIPRWYKNTEMRKRVQILFAILCAEEVLPYYEKVKPDDKSPHKAIQAAKDCLSSFADRTVVQAARAVGNVASYATTAEFFLAGRWFPDAAYAAGADRAAVAAANAAADAAYAATAATHAAQAAADAARADNDIDFIKLAETAVQQITEREK